MLFYNGRQLKRDGLTIPNLPYEYVLTKEENPDSWSSSHKFTLTKSGVSLVKFILHTYDSRISIQAVDYDAIAADGSNVDTMMHKTTAGLIYLDDLYYRYNMPKLRQLGGKVFSKTFNALRSRLSEGRDLIDTHLTIKMLKYVSEYTKDQVAREFPDLPANSIEFLNKCNERLELSRLGYCNFHTFTGELIGRAKAVRIRSGVAYIKPTESSGMYGYTSQSFSYNEYWLKEGEFLHEGTIVDLADGSETCPDCGTVVPTSYMVDDPEGGPRICHKCHSTIDQIHNYTTRVPTLLKFKAKKVTPSTIYLGCELEYETTNRDAARVKVGRALRGHAIMKSDGSIRDGFEVVTCPATLDIHLDVFKKFFDNRPVELKIASNVGMHVHVSRKPLSVLTVGKMTEFMNRSDNVKFITHIAGRAPNNYCRQEEHRSLSFPLVYKTGERYNTLNLNNADTIEFRIFSTPLTYEDFAHKVQFCQALTEYSKPGVLGVPLKTQTSHAHFIKWALENHKAYPELATKIKSFSA